MKNKFAAWLKKCNRQVWLEYGILSLVILGPMVLSGYILTLDLVFTPHLAWPSEISNTSILQIVMWALYHVLPGDVIEKFLLWGVVVLSGVGMHLLIEKEAGIYMRSSLVAPYVAGVFYAVNPFTYSRFMAGQWMVLLGYALLPFFVAALLRWLHTPTRRQAFVAGMWAFVMLSVSIHQAVIIPIVAAAAIGIYTFKTQKISISFIRQLVLFAGTPILLSSFWLVPSLLGNGGVAESVASFGHAHFQAFATGGGGVAGAVGEVLRLQGFWADAQQLYMLPQQKVPLWGLLWIGMWCLVVVGFIAMRRVNRRLVTFVTVLFAVGLIVATTPLAEWVGQIIPFVQGLREPHKFAMLIAFAFAICAAFGTAALQQRFEQRYTAHFGQTVAVGSLLLVFLITPTMLWGFSGQLSPRQYPNDWTVMDVHMRQHLAHKQILFLPWHQYANYRFSGRIIANPAEKFFENPIISSDEPEFRDVPPTRPNPEKRAVSSALKHRDSSALVASGLQYVLLAKEQDYQAYDWIKDHASVEKRTDTLLLLKIGG